MTFLFSSESVTEGHPDKIADQISDAILDAVLTQDPDARVACEAFLTTGLALVGGEITTSAIFDVQRIVRRVVRDIGYTDGAMGFDADNCSVMVVLGQQSPDIAMGVDRSGAGDQGLMFGYACEETPDLMPFPIQLAHGLARRLADVRKKGVLPYLRPDGKTQVSVRYENGQPIAVDTVVVSCQHDQDVDFEELKRDIQREVVIPTVPESMLHEATVFHINPTGRFVVGGPKGDSGLTGRKIIVDTYGGYARHGGGALSGKDATKVDRSAAYAARYVAKNIVAAKLASRCEIQIAYAIGVAEPVSIHVNSFGTGSIPDVEIEKRIRREFDLTPQGIIEKLDLKKPIFRNTATYGHFGRPEFPWEKLDMIDRLAR